MQSKALIAIALIASAAGTAFADDNRVDVMTPTMSGTSTITRSEVQAAALKARAAGALQFTSDHVLGNVAPMMDHVSMRSRAEVRAEALEARAHGRLALSSDRDVSIN